MGAPVMYRKPVQPSADGNTVDMDVERAQFADNALRYEASVRFVSEQMKAVLYEGRSPRQAVEQLMLRSLKRE